MAVATLSESEVPAMRPENSRAAIPAPQRVPGIQGRSSQKLSRVNAEAGTRGN